MKKGVLFDMDGVLVDVSRSYRTTIRHTVEHYLKKEISPDLIQSFKDRGGLNNDWDLSEAILKHFGIIISKKELIDFFQGIYLGDQFNGLIRNEKWLLDTAVIEKIKTDFVTGIVTGRPRMEAVYVLKRFRMEKYFPVMITMDDLPADKQKPHPDGILKAMDQLQITDAYYAGDTIDDMIAAGKAGVKGIGILTGMSDTEEQRNLFSQHGASAVLNSVNEIPEVIE